MVGLCAVSGNGSRNPDLTQKTQLLDKPLITSTTGRKSPPKTSSTFPILFKSPSSYNAWRLSSCSVLRSVEEVPVISIWALTEQDSKK